MGFYIGNISSTWKFPEFITAETLSRHTIYGVSFDGITHKGVRLYDAEGLNWSPSSTTLLGDDDFHSRKPFKFKRCLMTTGGWGESCTINSYYDDLGLTLAQYNQKAVDENLDRFIEYDCYYYSRPNAWTWLISPDYIDGFYPCPACDRGGKILSKWYMGEYMPNDSYKILEGQYPHVNILVADARTALRSKGYRLSDYANYNSVVMLALVKYADLNFQYCLGRGYDSGDSRQVSSGDAILGDDGYNGATRDANASIKVMGITDLYSNVSKSCDAIFESGGYVYINDDLDITELPTMDTWQAMGYKKVNSTLATGYDSCIKEFVYDSQFPWMTFPKAIGGDETNPIGDKCWMNNNTAIRSVLLGGWAHNETANGPFCWYSNDRTLLEVTFDSIGCLATAFPKTNNN